MPSSTRPHPPRGTARTHEALSDEEVFEMYRTYIAYMRHENHLVNQRATWFVTAQAALILIASYLLQKYMEVFARFFETHAISELSGEQKNLVALFAMFWGVVCGIGILTAGTAWRSIWAAIAAQDSLEQRWKDLFLKRTNALGFPQLRGGGDRNAGVGGNTFAKWLPPVMTLAWLAFVVVVLLLIKFKVQFSAIVSILS